MRVSFFYVIVSGLVSVVLIAFVTLVSQGTARYDYLGAAANIG